MRYQGQIISWKDDRGFGFISPNGGGKQVFVHIKSFSNRQRRPLEGDIVSYEYKTDARGRAQADHVEFVDERDFSTRSSKRNNVSAILAVAVFAVVAGSAYVGKLPVIVLWLYVIASAIAFVAYALDKSAARYDRWRIQESTLHFVALIGGWPGALVAQKVLRHKSSKQSFQFVFWITVVLNCGALGWLHSTSGALTLRSILLKVPGLTF